MTPDEVADRLIEMGDVLSRWWPGPAPWQWTGFGTSLVPVRTAGELRVMYRERYRLAMAEYQRRWGRRAIVPPARITREVYGTPRTSSDAPSGDEIDRMTEALGWLVLIDHERVKITMGMRLAVWTMALRGSPTISGRKIGVSRETIRRWWRWACEIIAKELNSECCAQRHNVAVSTAW